RRAAVAIALNLIPFAGIAFLWFVGAVRDRIGEREDRFFATVFFGSGLLFVAMLFVGAAVAGGLVAGQMQPGPPAGRILAFGLLGRESGSTGLVRRAGRDRRPVLFKMLTTAQRLP